MTAKILDGNVLSAKLRESLRHRAAELTAQGCRPGLCFPPKTTRLEILVPVRPAE